jgi:hypothetical protein
MIGIVPVVSSIDQIGKPLGAHGTGAGKTEGEEQSIYDIGLAAAIGPGYSYEIIAQRHLYAFSE